MRTNILSLKNLYSFLTMRDYPIYSTGIIGNEQKKGITLIRFWKENLLTEFTGGKYGRLIWKETGSRNRHTSEICNRSRQLNVYEEYMTEITAGITEDVLLRQIEQFRIFLVNHQFSYKVFVTKLEALLQEFAENDNAWNREIEEFFSENYKQTEKARLGENREKEFTAAWFLTFLAIHAMAGDAMGEAPMHTLRKNTEYSIEALWEKLHEKQSCATIKYLSSKKCEICSEALQTDHFWGREKEYFDLREMLNKEGHFLISGIGGIGKTELLRQLLQYAVRNQKVEFICAIQYENNFAESLLRAMAKKQQQDIFQDSFTEAIGELKKYAENHKLLILIDNINKDAEEDVYLQTLKDVPAVVFATSRLSQIEGFQTYPLRELDKQSCELVFRDNYTRMLSDEDISKLHTILDNPLCRHTMTVRWLGNVARTMNLSMPELLGKIEYQVDKLPGKDSRLGLQNIYKQLYSKFQLTIKQRSFLRIMASLPYRRYRVSFLCNYMDYFMDKEAYSFIRNLCRQGWLDANEIGVAMHPVIAESILDSPITYNELQSVFKEIEKKWTQMCGKIFDYSNWQNFIYSYDPDFISSAELLTDLFNRVAFAYNGNWIPLIILAEEVIKQNYAISPEHAHKLKDAVCSAENLADNMRIRGYLVCSECMSAEDSVLAEEMRKQKSHRTIDAEVYEQLLNLTALSLMMQGRFQTAEKYLTETKTGAESVERYVQLGTFSCLNMQINEAVKWNKKAIEMAEKNKDRYGRELFQLWGNQVTLYSGLKNQTETEKCMEHMTHYMRKDNVQDTWFFNFQKGVYLLSVSRIQEALNCLERAREYAGYYFGKNHINYALESEEIAIAQTKLKQFDRAEENHLLALKYMDNYAGYDRERGRILNNLGVMYLDWGKRNRAYTCLQEAFELAKDGNDIAMAEPAYNLARYYRLENNVKQELLYLDKACPVFVKFYTDNNEKTKEVKKRITEIRG